MKVLVRKLITGLRAPKRRAVLAEETVTENISSTGCYFSLSHEPEVGSKVRMEIEMRSKEGNPGKVLCRGVVVRVEKDLPNSNFGVACRIDHYRLVPTRTSSANGSHADSGQRLGAERGRAAKI